MPGTADRIADEDSLGKRSAVMAAGRADRINGAAAFDEKNSLVADMSGEHSVIRNIGGGNALAEIGRRLFRLGVAHARSSLEKSS